jgi:hypothetical protein
MYVLCSTAAILDGPIARYGTLLPMEEVDEYWAAVEIVETKAGRYRGPQYPGSSCRVRGVDFLDGPRS